jgi:hypothetical protein
MAVVNDSDYAITHRIDCWFIVLKPIALSLALSALLLSGSVEPARAQTRIGMVTTLSGPDAVSGQDMVDGFRLGLKRGGEQSLDVIVVDDQGRSDFARALSERLLRERADIITGFLSAATLRASADIVFSDRRDAFVISIGAGPAEFAGRACHANFFSVTPQNDTAHEAIGVHMAKAGVKNVYLLAPNSAEGKDAISAFKRTYKGGSSPRFTPAPDRPTMPAKLRHSVTGMPMLFTRSIREPSARPSCGRSAQRAWGRSWSARRAPSNRARSPAWETRRSAPLPVPAGRRS